MPTEEEFHQLTQKKKKKISKKFKLSCGGEGRGGEGGDELGVELPVTKPQKLRQGIQEALKEREEPGEPDDQADGAELHKTFQDDWNVKTPQSSQAVLQGRSSVLRSQEPYRDRQGYHLAQPLQNKVPAELGRARVDWLIHQRWRPPKVTEVREGDVLGVRTRSIYAWRRCSFQERVPQVAVGESVRELLQPDNDCRRVSNATSLVFGR